jgi:hypothetical protein
METAFGDGTSITNTCRESAEVGQPDEDKQIRISAEVGFTAALSKNLFVLAVDAPAVTKQMSQVAAVAITSADVTVSRVHASVALSCAMNAGRPARSRLGGRVVLISRLRSRQSRHAGAVSALWGSQRAPSRNRGFWRRSVTPSQLRAPDERAVWQAFAALVERILRGQGWPNRIAVVRLVTTWAVS